MPTYDGIGETITHKLEIEGDMFLQDIEGGSLSTQVPLEIFSDFETSGPEAINSRMLRLRVQNYGETDVSNSYVTDFGIRGEADKDYFFITAPQNTSNVGDQNTFVISSTSNVGIGTTDPGHYRLLVNNSSTKHFGVPGNDTPTTGDTLVYNGSGEWVYHFVEGTLPPGSINNEILTWNGANWVPNSSIITTNSNTSIGIGTYTPSANLHVIGSVTATTDVDISGKFQGGKIRVGSLLSAVPTNPNVTVPGDLTVSGTLTSDEWIHTSNLDITGNINVDHDVLIDGTYQGTGMRLDGTLQNLRGAIPDLSVAGSITATGDIKTDQTFRGTDASITGTITTSNITHGSELTVTTNLLMGPGTTLTASNIVGASPVTISSSIVMAAGTTLTTAAIEPPAGAESNLKITGTITTSNIVANTGDNLLVSSNLEVGTSNLFVDTTTGRVGIGTTSPGTNLHIVNTADITTSAEVLRLQRGDGTGDIQSNTRGTIGLYLRDDNVGGGEVARISWGHDGGDADPEGKGRLGFWTSDTGGAEGVPVENMTIYSDAMVKMGGALMIGVNGKDAGAVGNGRKNLFITSTYGGNSSANYGWWIGTQNGPLASNDNDLYFTVIRNGSANSAGYIQDGVGAEVQMNFTGQHRTFVQNIPYEETPNYEGMIVSANTNNYVRMSGGIAKGLEAITINESLPLVSLSNTAYDKKCFGVISYAEDPDSRTDGYGNFVSVFEKESGDTRIYINSVGEGAIWVVNTNGNMESGDYITTSNVAGYGMKQDDDILHNYTVAKITMDCDFNPPQQPVQIILKDAEGNNILDQYGQIQWVDDPDGATEPAYKTRQLEGGYIAAFVGCTYHCG